MRFIFNNLLAKGSKLTIKNLNILIFHYDNSIHLPAIKVKIGNDCAVMLADILSHNAQYYHKYLQEHMPFPIQVVVETAPKSGIFGKKHDGVLDIFNTRYGLQIAVYDIFSNHETFFISATDSVAQRNAQEFASIVSTTKEKPCP